MDFIRRFSVTTLLALGFTALAFAPLHSASAQGTVEGIKFDDKNGNGVQDADEPGLPNIAICLDGAASGGDGRDQAFEGPGDGNCVFTDVDGSYQFLNLLPGEHTVHEELPPGSINTTPLSQAFTITGNETVTRNFGNQGAMGPAPDVSLEGASDFEIYGLPVVHWNNPITIRKDVSAVHCAGSSAVAVKLVLGPFSDTGNTQEMLMTNEGGGIWAAAFPPLAPDHGTAAMSFYVDCSPDTPGFPEDESIPAGEDEFQDGGHIFIDPSGRIISVCDASPIEGATVTVLRFNDFLGIFEPAPETTPPLIPAVNPQITEADGAYGWMVTAGTYQVRAEKPGWSTAITGPLPVPPPQTGVNLALTPDGGCPPPPPVPQSKSDCMNGGWMSVFRADGSAFKNQGQCIQYVNTGK